MALTFVPSTKLVERSGFLDMNNGYILVGTLTATGSYATGGDTFASGQNLEDFLKRIGAGTVIHCDSASGLGVEWDATAKKLKFFQNGVELAAAAYPAAVTGRSFIAIGR
jgi:hypothetical protein